MKTNKSIYKANHENANIKEPADHSHDHIRGHNHNHENNTEPSHGNIHSHAKTKIVLNRLSRAIGHLTSVKGMVEQGRDCPEVLVQLAAVRSAINGVCEVILKDHLENCIVTAVNTGDMEALEELNRAVELLMK